MGPRGPPQRYLPTLQALAKEYGDREVQLAAINVAEEDSIVAMATQAVEMIGSALVEEIWAIMHENKPFDRARFTALLEQLG